MIEICKLENQLIYPWYIYLDHKSQKAFYSDKATIGKGDSRYFYGMIMGHYKRYTLFCWKD